MTKFDNFHTVPFDGASFEVCVNLWSFGVAEGLLVGMTRLGVSLLTIVTIQDFPPRNTYIRGQEYRKRIPGIGFPARCLRHHGSFRIRPVPHPLVVSDVYMPLRCLQCPHLYTLYVAGAFCEYDAGTRHRMHR